MRLRPISPRAAVGSLVTILSIPAWLETASAAPVGKLAPGFVLEDLSGRKVSASALRGRATVLVVGQTRKAAPPCKVWATGLLKRLGDTLALFQVIVVDKAWYIPRGAVIGSVKDFVPPALHRRVLLEWYRVFADQYGIPQHDDPVLLVIGADGVLRLQQRGPMTDAGIERIAALLRSLGPPSPARKQ